MFIDWKFIKLLSIVLALAFIVVSDATYTDYKKRGRYRPSESSPHLTTTIAAPEENLTNKCKKEIQTLAMNSYRYAKFIGVGSTMDASIVEICCEGYEPHGDSPETVVCKPVCENCLNGYCVSPGECECYNGFVSNDNGDCVFTCPISCLNGQCYLDGTCKCQLGYKLDVSKKFCRPICSDGCNGWKQNCTEPESCGCSTGYTLKENGCHPICEPDCGLGGECIETNVCTCMKDFYLKDGVCQTTCYQKCENGICFSKNRCICYKGFKYHEKSTNCLPI